MEVVVNDCNARQSIYTAEDIQDVYNGETNPNPQTNWLTLGSIIRPTVDISKFRFSAIYCVIRKKVQIVRYSVNFLMKTVHSSDKDE